jgi:UDP-N-acetylglucosamine 2-epimerase (non-hydrolysing)
VRLIRVLSVFGTRPEAVKMAPVVRAIEKRPDRFESVVCVTAQHRAMLDRVNAIFGLSVDHDLDVMRPNQSPAQTAAAIMDRLPPLIRSIRPTVLLVQGDTTTTFAASFAAFLENVPVGHVEAGLRSGDMHRPFPEEMNRVLTTRLASLHFAPTTGAAANLLAEKVREQDVFVTGNTVIDALLQSLRDEHRFDDPVLAALRLDRRLVVVTMHRRESFGAPLAEVCEALVELAGRFPDLEFVLPVHPNSNVRGPVEASLARHPSFRLVAPVDYIDFVQLVNRAVLILTDSGGIQEEAPSLGKPVLVLRDVTERPEGIAAGTSTLVGTDRRRIVDTASRLLTDPEAYGRMARVANPYGDGRAGERIVQILDARFATG